MLGCIYSIGPQHQQLPCYAPAWHDNVFFLSLLFVLWYPQRIYCFTRGNKDYVFRISPVNTWACQPRFLPWPPEYDPAFQLCQPYRGLALRVCSNSIIHINHLQWLLYRLVQLWPKVGSGIPTLGQHQTKQYIPSGHNDEISFSFENYNWLNSIQHPWHNIKWMLLKGFTWRWSKVARDPLLAEREGIPTTSYLVITVLLIHLNNMPNDIPVTLRPCLIFILTMCK